MDAKGSVKLLGALLLLFAASGANCRQYVRQYTEPRTLVESATLEQIAEKVNGNSAKIVNAQSTQAKFKADGVMPVNANIAFEAPRRLHVQASFMGPQLDLGSNDEQFWIWIKQHEPPAVFVCRHDQFATSAAQQLMPIEPERLIEAIGMPHIDPSLALGPPRIAGANRIEIGSRLPSAAGELKKITIIDAWNGHVLEQNIYDPLGMLIAQSLTSRYSYDPTTGAAMPRTIEIRWPTAKMAFTLEVSDWMINRIPADNVALWQVPHPKDYPVVDLADPSVRFMDPNAPPGAAPPLPPPTNLPAAIPPQMVPPPVSQMEQPLQTPSGLSYPSTAYPQGTATYPHGATTPIR